MVWEKVSELMGSPELLVQQVERWFTSKEASTVNPAANVDVLRAEVAKLKKQDGRYASAYAAGAFEITQLKEYTAPLKQRIASLEVQIANALVSEAKRPETNPPTVQAIASFANTVRAALPHLKFKAKREIVLSVIEKIVATQKEIRVYGHIPITPPEHVEFKTDHRHGQGITRHLFGSGSSQRIPFSFDIAMPAPRYQRTIVARDSLGRIIHSAPPDMP